MINTERDYLQLAPNLAYIAVGKNVRFLIGPNKIEYINDETLHQVLQTLSTHKNQDLLSLTQIVTSNKIPALLHTIQSKLADGTIQNKEESLSTLCLDQANHYLKSLDDSVSFKTIAFQDWKQVANYHKNLQPGSSPYCPIIVTGPLLSAGPILIPHSSGPCPFCIDSDIAMAHPIIEWLSQRQPAWNKNLKISQQHIDALIKKTGKLTANEPHILKVLQTDNTFINTEIVKNPDCHHCGDNSLFREQMIASIKLEPNSNRQTYMSAYRSKSVTSSWSSKKHLANDITGCIKEIRDIQFKNLGLAVTRSFLPRLPTSSDPEITDFGYGVYGKGRTQEAARVSALFEGIERGSIRYTGNEPIIFKSFHELKNQAIVPSDIQHFSKDQLDNPTNTLKLGPVPLSFCNDVAYPWLPAWSLTHKDRRYVPADIVLLGRPGSEESRIGVFETNGLSAGNTKEEAILQGLFELIERDAVAIWWFNRLRMPAVDTFFFNDDPWYQETLNAINQLGFDVSFLDLTHDLGVPVTACIGKKPEGWLIGYGCHLDPRIATSRALSELVQMIGVMQPCPAPISLDTSYLLPDVQQENVSPLEFDEEKNDSALIINKIIDHFSKKQLEVIILNCSRPAYAVPVFKVIVPGLRAYRPRFGKGRLFSVPLDSGKRKTPLSISELTTYWLTS